MLTQWELWKLHSPALLAAGLSPNVIRVCLRYEAYTLEAIAANTPSELMRWQNFGRKSAAEVERVLEAHGLRLPPDPALGDPTLRELIAAANVTRARMKEAAEAHKAAVAAVNRRRDELFGPTANGSKDAA